MNISIAVLDVNDNRPQFVETFLQFEIAENAPVGSLIASLQATDQDLGSNADLTYTVENDTPFAVIPSAQGGATLIVQVGGDRRVMTPSIFLPVECFRTTLISYIFCSFLDRTRPFWTLRCGGSGWWKFWPQITVLPL